MTINKFELKTGFYVALQTKHVIQNQLNLLKISASKFTCKFPLHPHSYTHCKLNKSYVASLTSRK